MEQLREQLKETIKNLYNLDFTPDLTPSPDGISADYSTNAPLKLAKELHKSPMQISEELLKAFVSSAEITPPGFLNFKLDDVYLNNELNNLYNDFDQQISSDIYKGQTIICEFSDPNPFKILHVGHLYTSIVGDAISRLYEYAGAKVIRANFGGDVGLHVAKTMYALEQKDITNLHIEDIAKCYIEGTALYDEDEHAKQEITKLNKEIYKINAENLHDTPLANLYWQGRELSYAYFNDFYAKIGVHFDKYYPESTVATLGLAKVQEELEKGVYQISDGAVIFDGKKFGLHTRVFISKEGVPTYETKDVGLIFTKWQDYHFDKSIVITGNEQLDYMKVVLKSVEQYSPDLVLKTIHLTHGLVKLPGGVKMSSRKGNFLKAVDVLDMTKEALKDEYHSEDSKISLAATKYAFLKYKMGGDIIFDPKESVKMTGNSGPYLLYSAVRAKKILERVSNGARDEVISRPFATDEEQRSEVSPVTTGRDERVAKESSRELSKKLLAYEGILQESVTEMAPHKVATYLYELAQDFSRFYEHCPVAGSDQESERTRLVKLYLNIMTHGLGLLGIEIPDSM